MRHIKLISFAHLACDAFEDFTQLFTIDLEWDHDAAHAQETPKTPRSPEPGKLLIPQNQREGDLH